ncbi:MAG: hypothetical protein ACKESB_02395 [Candidatus Hodgkinia cicadicola]
MLMWRCLSKGSFPNREGSKWGGWEKACGRGCPGIWPSEVAEREGLRIGNALRGMGEDGRWERDGET